MGAGLFAAGLRPAAIAQELGVSVGVVHGWSKSAAFRSRRNEILQERVTQIVPAALAAAQEEIVGAVNPAVAVLLAALDATDDEGNPLHELRLDAAKFLIGRVPITDVYAQLLVAQEKAREKDDGKGPAIASAQLIVHLDADGKLKDPPQVVESTAEEVQ